MGEDSPKISGQYNQGFANRNVFEYEQLNIKSFNENINDYIKPKSSFSCL